MLGGKKWADAGCGSAARQCLHLPSCTQTYTACAHALPLAHVYPLAAWARLVFVHCRTIDSYPAILEEVKAFRITDWPLFAKCGEYWLGRGGAALAHMHMPQDLLACPPRACCLTSALTLHIYPSYHLHTSSLLPCAAAYVTGVVLIGFLLHPVHHVDPAWFAILGAIVL